MSSPLRAGSTVEEELDYYKKQYEQLETDLAEFQTSSKELEEQLEKDIDAAEKKERKLREQVEKVSFEVEEWKTKHKQAKAEANNAQNVLQKEITTMREANRALQLKLRDIEVMNDDYERQARNTESSLEDLESKYNVAIERGVMLEEEIKVGEKEREALRIGTQRLRDELSDLKVESEITLEKLRLANESVENLRSRKPSPLAVESLRTKSPGSEISGMTPSSPSASTPPPRSDTASEAPTPPSPPLSDSPRHSKPEFRTPVPLARKRTFPADSNGPRTTPQFGTRNTKHTRGPSLTSSQSITSTEARSMRPPTIKSRPMYKAQDSVPRSDSLYQIKALRGRMQKIEERVHSARSKLPAPSNTTPKGSPRHAAGLADNIPSSVTMRRSSRRPMSIASSSIQESENDSHPEAVPVRRQSHVKRLSFGIPRPASAANHPDQDRPPSALDRPPSAAAMGRPQSRTSMSSAINRPASRAGTKTPLAGYHNMSSQHAALPSRSRSSMGGDYGLSSMPTRTHRPSASVSELRRLATSDGEDTTAPISPTQRRTTLDRSSTSYGLSTPSALTRRQSGGIPQYIPARTLTRRESGLTAKKEHDSGARNLMRPPSTTPMRKQATDVGETY